MAMAGETADDSATTVRAAVVLVGRRVRGLAAIHAGMARSCLTRFAANAASPVRCRSARVVRSRYIAGHVLVIP